MNYITLFYMDLILIHAINVLDVGLANLCDNQDHSSGCICFDSYSIEMMI